MNEFFRNRILFSVVGTYLKDEKKDYESYRKLQLSHFYNGIENRMTVEELTNIFLRLDVAGKAEDSEFLFGSSEDGVNPFPITGVYLDED